MEKSQADCYAGQRRLAGKLSKKSKVFYQVKICNEEEKETLEKLVSKQKEVGALQRLVTQEDIVSPDTSEPISKVDRSQPLAVIQSQVVDEDDSSDDSVIADEI